MDTFCQAELDKLKELKKERIYEELVREANSVVCWRGQNRLVSFACNDYLGLAGHKILKMEAIKAIELYGIGGKSSRALSGNHFLYRILEEKLANYYKKDSALVFSSGYLTNIGVISAIMGRHDLIIADKLVHSCILDGAALSGAKLVRFDHNNVEHCVELLEKYRPAARNCLIICESIYSMDGNLAPVSQLIEIAKKYNAWTLVDDAHGFGLQKTEISADLCVGTLSKAAGCMGGYVCASQTVINYLRNKSRTVIYTTALPPAVLAASIAALELISKNINYNIPLRLAELFCKNSGLPKPQSHIVPIIFSSNQAVLTAKRVLEEYGFLTAAIRPPTSPTPRLRFTFTAMHKPEDVIALCAALKNRVLENA